MIFILVVAVSCGLLAAGAYWLNRSYRMEGFIERSTDRARLKVEVIRERLNAAPSDPAAERILRNLADRGDVEAALVWADRAAASHPRFGEEQVPAEVRQAIAGGEPTHAFTRIEGVRYLVLSARLPAYSANAYFFFWAEGLFRSLAVELAILIGSWAVIVALAGLIGSSVARRTLVPVARASKAAHRLAEGDFEARLLLGGDDEFGEWAVAFNRMAEALQQKIQELVGAHERERRFTSDVAHELRTPLTGLVGAASLIGEELTALPPEMRRSVEVVMREVANLHRLVEELLEISRLDGGRAPIQKHELDLGALTSAVVKKMGSAKIQLQENSVSIVTDPRRVERILSNLVNNALVHGRQEVCVRIYSEKGEAFIEVSDRGPGIAREHLLHVFERFYKATAARGGGSGLGLAIAWENAQLLGGTIDVTSEPGAGSRFTLRLPLETTNDLRY